MPWFRIEKEASDVELLEQRMPWFRIEKEASDVELLEQRIPSSD
jgi:hypothetical protein